MPTKITPPRLARRWGISDDKVLAWIRSGELRAMDASTKRGGRPRFLIDEADIAAFEAARAISGPAASRPRKKRSSDVIEFFQ
jgi:hypothetical protein